MKALRGTPLDPFGYAATPSRRTQLIAWYRGLVEEILEHVAPRDLSLAIEIASLPDQIRGYEHIKMSSIHEAKRLAEEKLVPP